MYQFNTLMSMAMSLMSMSMERFCDLKLNLWLIDEYIGQNTHKNIGNVQCSWYETLIT